MITSSRDGGKSSLGADARRRAKVNVARGHSTGITWALTSLLAVAACQPRVAIEAPKDPIVINLNIKIEQEVRVKVERDVDNLFDDNDNLF
jgi:hypothetical protein